MFFGPEPSVDTRVANEISQIQAFLEDRTEITVTAELLGKTKMWLLDRGYKVSEEVNPDEDDISWWVKTTIKAPTT